MEFEIVRISAIRTYKFMTIIVNDNIQQTLKISQKFFDQLKQLGVPTNDKGQIRKNKKN